MSPTPSDAITITRLRAVEQLNDHMADEIREGLAQRPRRLPSKYFYDERGSELFDEITLLPEYYVTRAETEILEEVAESIVRDVRPDELIELGAGFSRKTRVLLEAMTRLDHGGRLVCLDVAEEPLRDAGERLLEKFPELRFEGVVGDFEQDLDRISRDGRRLVAFLGSTFGNFEEAQRLPFLRQVRRMLVPGDAFLIGLDLVKDRRDLEAAYNDAAGVTAEFNKNVLRVVNRELDADFPVDAFEHTARYADEQERIEMWLRAKRDVDVELAGIDYRTHIEAGEEIRTELSCKFTRESAEELFASADLQLRRWDTDLRQRFALALATP
jgi:L-histidine N-alpha-methyltransferase